MIGLITVLLHVLLYSSTDATISEYGTLNLNFAPDRAQTLSQSGTQVFRAPMCSGSSVDQWTFTAKVYLMNVPWDSRDYGDDNFLKIRVSNGVKVVRDNTKGTDMPLPYVKPFKYDKNTWGSDDIYVEVTASEGSPTYQYGVELVAEQPDSLVNVADGMEDAVDPDTNVNTDVAITMEQIAVPYQSKLTATQTGQYTIPFCFEDEFSLRSLTATTAVNEEFKEAPGGVAAYICSAGMIRDGQCYRTVAVRRGNKFHDASGAKMATVTPSIDKTEYGPLYLLILAQGDYMKQIPFTISTKLPNPPVDDLKLTGDRDRDIDSILVYLKENYGNKPADIDPNFVPDELRDEL